MGTSISRCFVSVFAWLDLHPWAPVLIVGLVPFMLKGISKKMRENQEQRMKMHEESMRQFGNIKDRLDITNGKVLRHEEKLAELKADVRGLEERERDRWGSN